MIPSVISHVATWTAVAGTFGALTSMLIVLRQSRQIRSHVEALERALEAHPPTTPSFDVFVSHASSDADFADDLARALRDRGVTVWSSNDQIQPGDSLTEKIADGLARSRYGVVVLSPAFFRGAWPQKELTALSKRASSGGGAILPIWDHVGIKDVYAYSPVLADMLAMHREKESVDQMADRIAEIVTAG